MTPRARLARAAFPGDARAWRAAAIVSALALAAVLLSVLIPRDYYTGTNGVRTRAFVTELGTGQTLCTSPQRIPAGTGRVEFQIATRGPRPPLSIELRAPGRAPARSGALGRPTTRLAKVDFPIPEPAAGRTFELGTICLRSGGEHVAVGGAGGLLAGDRPVVVNGHPVASRVALWFRPPLGQKRTLVSLAPDILRRATLFRANFVGRWTYVAILLLLMPALMYAGVRLLALAAAGRAPRIPLPAAVAVVAFAGAAAWSLITPSFNAPDETEHFAYAQHLAETGNAPAGHGPTLSSEEQTAADALRLSTSTAAGDGKPPWLAVAERDWAHDVSHIPPGGRAPPRDDGGGLATATSAHSPLYYSLLVPAYKLGSGRTIWTRLWLMRLVSALLGAVVAACAVAIVRELVPRRPLLAAAAGLLVAFEPMFSFMSGAVNNDSGVNAGAAVVVYLLVRGLMRGLTVRLGLALGAALAITPLMKGTGFALYPAALVGVAAMLWRARRGREWVRPAAAIAGSGGALWVAWSAVSSSFHRGTITTPGGSTPGFGTAAFHDPLGFAGYLWQVFLPRLPFMSDGWPHIGQVGYAIWIVRGFAAFGWYAMTFSDWVYYVIAATLIVLLALGVIALRSRRPGARRRAVPLVVLALVVAGVIGGVHAYYFGGAPHVGAVPEQGRYAFPAITALAAGAAGALLGLPRRWFVPAAACLVTAMLWLDFAGQLMALARFYS